MIMKGVLVIIAGEGSEVIATIAPNLVLAD
jgi:hypothetical protein